jgi:SAM-dependent methyltransferase
MFGIDLLPSKITQAKHYSPDIEFLCGNIADLPFPSSCFDIAISFTVFTSILDGEMRRNCAREILRVLKPGGVFILHDFF